MYHLANKYRQQYANPGQIDLIVEYANDPQCLAYLSSVNCLRRIAILGSEIGVMLVMTTIGRQIVAPVCVYKRYSVAYQLICVSEVEMTSSRNGPTTMSLNWDGEYVSYCAHGMTYIADEDEFSLLRYHHGHLVPDEGFTSMSDELQPTLNDLESKLGGWSPFGKASAVH